MTTTTNWLKYYRASLIDGSRGDKNTIFPNPIKRASSQLQHITESEIAEIWDDKNVIKLHCEGLLATSNAIGKEDINTSGTNKNSLGNTVAEHELTEFNKIEIAPLFITATIEHGYKVNDTKIHYPFWIPAYVSKTGVLHPPKEGEIPLFIRNHLEPNPKDLPAIATIEILDKKMKNRSFNTSNWSNYWEDCEHFFKDVSGKCFDDYRNDDYHLFSICPLKENNTTRNILKLYNDLVFDKNAKNQHYPILEKVLEVKEEAKNYHLTDIEIFLNSNHYGQMNGEFPLSVSQRVAFAEFTSKYNQNVFAINGPPGTGKTTLLQSFIANAISIAVLNKEHTPLLVGCSTNNQAITNILDSMALEETSDTLCNRWFPKANSFGLYLTTTLKAKEASKKYQIVTTPYLNEGFARDLEDNAKVSEYTSFFKEKFKAHFQIDSTLENIDPLEYLSNIIKTTKQQIDNAITSALQQFEAIQVLKNNGYDSYEELTKKIEKLQLASSHNRKKQKQLQQTQHDLLARNNTIPFYIKLLPLTKFRLIREHTYKLVTHSFYEEFPKTIIWYNYTMVYCELEKLLLETVNKQKELDTLLLEVLELKKDLNSRQEEYQKFTTRWLKNYNDKWENLLQKTGKEYDNLNVLEDTAVKLDISYRNELFWCCVHYREWEYIQELKQLEQKDKERGKKSYSAKLRRLSKITPLFIATFHTLPKFSHYYNAEKPENYYRQLFDIMFIDEAGQVTPEVAIPALTLTKKVLAVGDVHQIEPVWGVTKRIDYTNAKKYRIVKHEEDFNTIDHLGLTVSSGSIMKLMKKATPFAFKHTNGELEKGAYLLEHRRCLNPIIGFSKDNIYKGSLKLMVGNNHTKKHDLPPLGYIHVNGNSEKHNGSSRKNTREARTIIQWVLNNKEKLENAYDKSLHEVLAIITPFSAQKRLLKQLLNTHFDKRITDNFIVGTVHALQGAEKPIIVFSTVHDTKDNTLFFDYQGKFNLLNVALTRAKHSFIVIGNMGIINPKSNSPSGKLGATLFSKKAYALDDSFIYKSEIVYPKLESYKVTRINTLKSHVDCLKRIFKVAKKEVLIFSPFMSINAIQHDAIEMHIKDAIAKDVKIKVITDKTFDVDKKTQKLNPHSEKGRNAIQNAGASLLIKDGIHNKTICVDDSILIEGSFNWLSATRDESNNFHKENASVILQGPKVKEDIAKIRQQV